MEGGYSHCFRGHGFLGLQKFGLGHRGTAKSGCRTLGRSEQGAGRWAPDAGGGLQPLFSVAVVFFLSFASGECTGGDGPRRGVDSDAKPVSGRTTESDEGRKGGVMEPRDQPR
jgi:hypothetical protein